MQSGFISYFEIHNQRNIPQGYNPCNKIVIPLSFSCLTKSIEHAKQEKGALLWKRITDRLKNSGIRALMIPRDCENIEEIAEALLVWIQGRSYGKETITLIFIKGDGEEKEEEITRWKSVLSFRNGNMRKTRITFQVKTLLPLPRKDLQAIG